MQRASASVRRALTVILENNTGVGQCVEVRRDDAARRVHEIHLVVAQICTPRPWTDVVEGVGALRESALGRAEGRVLHARSPKQRIERCKVQTVKLVLMLKLCWEIEEFMRSNTKEIRPSLSAHMHSAIQ
jgi:hypothetical protein